ncbi:MAG: chemotaxis protein CheW [Deltaproteobacteria bacterium]|nr:MAG: chemotaxis protein CheW [Deltaproteobacteria bacterium]
MAEVERVLTEGAEGKYLLFELGGEEYGIEILRVREIIGLMDITPVPQSPPFIRGVINLRGKIIPVLDMRRRFGMEEGEYTERSCIIVTELKNGKDQLMLGMLVDGVREVANIPADQIDPAPQFGASVDTRYIMGMAKMKERVAILLDVEKLLKDGEVALLEEVPRG